MERSFTVTLFVKDSLGSPPQRIDSLPSVELEATETDRVYELAQRSFEVAGLSPLEYKSVLFVTRADQEGRRRTAPYLDVGIGADGLLFWRVGAGSEDTTIGDIERAVEAGLFQGDPHAFSVDRGGYGDSGLIRHWDDLYAFLEGVGGVSGGILVIGAAAKFLGRFVSSHLSKWIPRHARFPSTFFNSIVSRSEWSADSLARLLDVSESEVRDLLSALGYESGEDDIFRLSKNAEKAHLRKRLGEEHFLWDGWHDVRKAASEDEPPG